MQYVPLGACQDATLNRMTSDRRGGRLAVLNLLSVLNLLTAILLIGCASPGPPHPPSLRLPEPVRDLTARRTGDAVELRYTVPWQSTDKQALRGAGVRGVLCRELEHQSCVAVAGLEPPLQGPRNTASLHDTLPPALATGPPRLLSYRVEFFSAAGKSAGKSDAAFTVAGAPPPAVEGLTAQGSRLGVVLRWKPAPSEAGEVLIQREDLSPRVAQSKTPAASPSNKHEDVGDVWLKSNADAGRTLDTSAVPGTSYRYIAVRQRVAEIGGRSLPYRSAESAPVAFTPTEIYAPLAPTGLTANGFVSASGGYAVDLIWQPVDDAGLLAGLAGYNVYREPVDATGSPTGQRIRLNSAAAPLPGFHDATAQQNQSYRYSVTAVDSKGNESPAASFVLQP